MNASEIETALRYICQDDDGRIYAPVTDDVARPLVYLPGHGIHAHGYEIHLITIYPVTRTVECLVDNGYTLTVDEDPDVIGFLVSRIWKD